MKIHTECVPCLLKRIIFETEQSTDDPAVKTNTIRNACKLLSELYDPNECSATIATKIHKLIYELLGDDDPYKILKQRSNEVALSLVPQVETLIKKADDPLKMSILCAIVGNTMDFGIAGGSSHPERLKEIFNQLIAEGISYDDTEKLKTLLARSSKIMLFTDNCGEIVFDKILCHQLKRFNPDLHLTVVVKGEHVLSDATIHDAEQLRFHEVADDILTTGCFAVGVDFTRLPSEVKQCLTETDLIICKGMANYEAFSETNYRPIAYLLRTKCNPIASSMKLPQNINAVKLYT